MFKYFLSLSVTVLLLSSCFNSSERKHGENDRKIVGKIITIEKSEKELYNDQYTTLLERDLGTVGAGETISGILNFTTTVDLLNIKEIKGTCGCMTLTDTFKSLNKGEVATVRYTISTTGKEGEEYFDIIIDSSLGKFIIEMKAFVK